MYFIEISSILQTLIYENNTDYRKKKFVSDVDDKTSI